jgi:hypothetical protein
MQLTDTLQLADTLQLTGLLNGRIAHPIAAMFGKGLIARCLCDAWQST